MSQYTSIIPLLLETLRQPTHCRGMVSEQRLFDLFDKVIIQVQQNCPDHTDHEKQFLAERTAWNWAWKTESKDAAGRWIIDPPFPGKLEDLASEIAEVADYSLGRAISGPSLTIPQPAPTITQPSGTISQPNPTISQENPLPELQNLTMAQMVARAPSPRPSPSQQPSARAIQIRNDLTQHWQKSNLISVPRGYIPPLGWTMEGFPVYSIISSHKNAFPAITGRDHQFYHRLNGNLGKHVTIRYFQHHDTRQILLWPDVKAGKPKNMDEIQPTIEYLYGFLGHWNSIRPEAKMIDDHWDRYVATINPPSAEVAKVLPTQKPRHQSQVAAPRPSHLLLPPPGPSNALVPYTGPSNPAGPPRSSTPRVGLGRGRGQNPRVAEWNKLPLREAHARGVRETEDRIRSALQSRKPEGR